MNTTKQSYRSIATKNEEYLGEIHHHDHVEKMEAIIEENTNAAEQF